MEVALRPRINAPDVVRSALGQRDKISENSIDKLFAAPSKILIPERYIPEQVYHGYLPGMTQNSL